MLGEPGGFYSSHVPTWQERNPTQGREHLSYSLVSDPHTKNNRDKDSLLL